MIRLKDGKYIIGFDDGYQLGKTANFVFDNGVHKLGSVEPTLKEHSLFYDGEYFKVGEGRSAITEDKVSDDTAWFRTMAGIAMELRNAGIKKAEVVLAVGLPFSNYGRDKLKLIDYYHQQSILDFSYEGEDYSVTIVKVIVCPQCYSAVASRLGNMKGDYLVVDIGSKTTDVVYVQNGLPIESKSITIEKAVVKWMKEIQHDMKVQIGKEIPEHEILKVMLKEENHVPTVYKDLICRMLREKLRSLELELSERGYSLDYINLIYVGGGALMAHEHAGKYRNHTAYDCDLCANAKGYEFFSRTDHGKEGGMMKEEQRAIHIRFNMTDEADCDLYLNLVKAAGNSTSLTAYVKRALSEYMSMSFEMTERQTFHEQMLSVVREEMQTQGMKLVGALLAGIGTVNTQTARDEIASKETELPEVCGELPDELSSVLDLIS